MPSIVITVPVASITNGNTVVRDARQAAVAQAALQGQVLTGAYTTSASNGNLNISFSTVSVSTGSGAIGPMGPQGPQGAEGPTGPQGPKGDTGDAGAAGQAGAQGPIGQTGAQGPQGNVGPTGQTGAKGDTGTAGAPGSPGQQGIQGVKGDTGSQGQTGQQGIQGNQGQQGPQGLQGVPGPIGGSNDIVRALAADATGANGNAAQPIFVGAAAITLAANTAYEFDLIAHIFRAAGTVSHTTGMSFGGTATVQPTVGIDYLAQAASATGNNLSADSMVRGEGVGNLVLTNSVAVATENLRIRATGIVRTLAGGTFIPQFQFSAAPGGAPTIRRNSYIRLRPLGAASFTAQN